MGAEVGTAECGARSDFRVLSLDGGGYLGLATAAFIAGIERHFSVRLHDQFDLFCGTSTGAIIAVGLAAGRTGSELVDLYKVLGSTVFKKRGPFRRLFGPKYRTDGLRTALDGQFGSATLADVHSSGKSLLIPAFNLSSGRPTLFKTDHSPDLTAHSALRLTDVALASAAAPYYFPIVEIRNPTTNAVEAFCDGGVAANHPALLGYAEALTAFRKPPERVRLLSISTPRLDLSEPPGATKHIDRSIINWRTTLAAIFIDSSAMLSDGVLRRIISAYPHDIRPRYVRVELPNRQRLEMDNVSPDATQLLTNLGVEFSSNNDIRREVSSILEV